MLWRLISKLSLNYLSLVTEGGDAFREILRLHNFTGALAAKKNCAGKPNSACSGTGLGTNLRVTKELEPDHENDLRKMRFGQHRSW